MASLLPALECLHWQPRQQTRAHPLLLVHGAFSGAWCWDEGFAGYFVERGYDVHAVSLRGHGKSGGSLLTASLEDFVDDVASVAASLSPTPILVGHSMGGLVVQKLMQRRALTAAVLMASVPPDGLFWPTWWLWLRDPLLLLNLNLLQSLGPSAVPLHMARKALFSPDVPDERVAWLSRQSQGESPRALLDSMGFGLPLPGQHYACPTLVMGAEHDALIPPFSLGTTAHAYNAPLVIVPDIAHAMMLDTHWPWAAASLAAWLDQQGL